MALTFSFEYADITVPGMDRSPAFDINNRGEVVGLYGPNELSDQYSYLAKIYRYDHGKLTRIDLPGSVSVENVVLGGDGTIAGSYEAADRFSHAFVYADGVARIIDPPGTLFPSVTAINNSGEVIGETFQPGHYYIYEGVGYVYSGGKSTTLDYPGAFETRATAINDSGDVVGEYTYTVHHAGWGGLVYRSGEISSLDAIKENFYDDVHPVGISNKNEIFGNHDWYGFVAAPEGVTFIDVPNSWETRLKGLDITGRVVGNYADPYDHTHGFTYDKGKYTTIDMPGASDTVIAGINHFGVVIGNYTDAVTHDTKGFLWYGGKSVTISPPDATDTVVNEFNDWGQVVGSYQTADRVIHGFVATPAISFDDTRLSFIQASHPGTTGSDGASATSANPGKPVSAIDGSHVADLLRNALTIPAQLALTGMRSDYASATGAVLPLAPQSENISTVALQPHL